MTLKREELAIVTDYGSRYRSSAADVAISIERRVFGSDFGACGYTSLRQADLLADLLALKPGERVLDLGAGCGWPGLHLAIKTGCSVVSTDLPLAGLARARERAQRENLAGRGWSVASSARHLPFCDSGFDAIVHIDVLC